MNEQIASLRSTMQIFVQERLEAKLAKLKPEQGDEREALLRDHELHTWLTDAARRVDQIQLATHILKPTHPDARGTNLHVQPAPIDEPGLVGTHSLPPEHVSDVVGNAAALDVYKFLSLEHEGTTLLKRAIAQDESFKAALSADPAEADALCSAFAGITESEGAPASHTLAKQLYFPVDEPQRYHLLAPLFPTSLVHRLHGLLREHRFGDRAKAAREARRKNEPWHEGFHEYPDLAIQKFGGTKPQNISQLNSERRGENWLLCSIPPTWTASSVAVPFQVSSVFERKFGGRRTVRELVGELKRFLQSTSYNNRNIRDRRAQLVEAVCDEALQYASSLRALTPGWTASAECKLVASEQLWLDPGRAESDEDFAAAFRWKDWPAEVSARFANWLNQAISSDKIVLGDDEHHEWKGLLNGEINLFRDYLEADRG